MFLIPHLGVVERSRQIESFFLLCGSFILSFRTSLLLTWSYCFSVAVQCLETAFEVSTDDQSLAVPMTLPEIFTSATAKVNAEDPCNFPNGLFCIAEMTSLNILAFASMSCSKSELISLFFQSQSWNEMHNKYQYYLLWLTKGKVSYYILVKIQMPFFKRLNGALALVQVSPDVNFTWAFFLSVSLWSCTPEESVCLFLIVVLQEVSFNPVFVCLTVFSSVAGQQQLHPKLPNRGTESRGWKTQKWRWVQAGVNTLSRAASLSLCSFVGLSWYKEEMMQMNLQLLESGFWKAVGSNPWFSWHSITETHRGRADTLTGNTAVRSKVTW